MKFEELKAGQSYEMKRTFSLREVTDFAQLSYDTNPIHTDEEFAKTTPFGQVIVPGFLTGSMFSAIIGTKFPGFGTIYLNQNMVFRKPVFLNRQVTAVVRVKELFPEKRRVLLETCCYDENQAVLIEGTALVKLP